MYDRSESVCYWNLLLFWQFMCFCGKTISSGVFHSCCTFKRHCLRERFQETGNLYDKYVKAHKYSIYLCMEGVSAAWEAITRSLWKSMECSAQQIAISTSTTCRPLWWCHLHESELNQALLEDGMARHHAFMWEYGVLLESKCYECNIVTWWSTLPLGWIQKQGFEQFCSSFA